MFKYFKLEDFDCQETGVNGVNVKLLRLRSLNLELTLKALQQI
jgi:hypothetical protein